MLTENEVLSRYLSHRIGPQKQVPGKEYVPTINRLIEEGVQLREGKLYWGTGNEVALKYAGAIRAPEKTASWMGKAWAVHSGVSLPDAQKFFVTQKPWAWRPTLENPMAGGMAAQIVGAQSKIGLAANWAQAYSTEWVGRFNRLLRAPVDFPVIENVFSGIQKAVKKLPGRPELFAVKDGTGGQMMARLLGKYGLIVPTAYMGYKTLDWMVQGSNTAKGTIFEEGITTGIASMGVKAHIAASSIAEATGLHAYREKQEELAPGSTSFSRLMAFPLMGAMAAGGGLYGIKTAKMLKMQWQNPGMESWQARAAVEEEMKHFSGTSLLSRTAKRMVSEDGIYSQPGRLGNIWRRLAEKSGADNELSFKLLKKVGPAKLAATVGFAAGLATALPFLPGALIPEDRPDKLRDIYSGREEVEVRQGRMWEFGRSAWTGDKISYYRPNWYARMRMDSREKGLWGDEAQTMSPFRRWLKQEFTYDWELEHYRDRPYPITSLPLSDVPFLGPLLANTVGRLIKPPKLMHTDEWVGKGGETAVPQSRSGQRIATEIGEKVPGKPEDPNRPEGVASEQWYRMTEMAGLPGFMFNTLKESITGTGDLFDQQAQLESARRAFGFERKYWEQEWGGLFGSSEAFRRLYPHRQRQIPAYNPIRNSMPSWMPGAGEKSPDFQTGDPYIKVPEGELRLPGRGYEARFPELEGTAPEDYPLIHKFRILADVAPYSEAYGQVMNEVRHARKMGWAEENEAIFQRTITQLAARKQKKEFNEYQYLSPTGLTGERSQHWGGEDSTGLLSTLNELHSQQQPGEKGTFANLFGGYWEALSHNAETTLDQLTPMSPGAKLVHQRTAIEDYERTRLYGTSNAFWNHPVRDFFRPTFWLGAQELGFKGTPTHIEQRRQLEAYFDTLKYVKYARLTNIAREEHDYEAEKEFVAKKNQTLFGINPYTFNFTSIFNALPRTERDYFNAFADAKTEEERKRILEIVPENERALYAARWRLNFVDEVKRAQKSGALSEDQITEAEGIIANIAAEAQSGGLPSGKELNAEYLSTKGKNESYADWYRRTHLLTQLKNIPGPDWVGWHPSVDLNDVKLRVVQTIGEDMHDYDLWQQQAQAIANKPFIDEAATEPILDQKELSQEELHDRIDSLLLHNGLQGSTFTRTKSGGSNEVEMDVKVDQSASWMSKAVR